MFQQRTLVLEVLAERRRQIRQQPDAQSFRPKLIRPVDHSIVIVRPEIDFAANQFLDESIVKSAAGDSCDVVPIILRAHVAGIVVTAVRPECVYEFGNRNPAGLSRGSDLLGGWMEAQ